MKSKESTSTTMNIQQFPQEVLLSILLYLDPNSLLKCSQVCQAWHHLSCQFSRTLWRSLCVSDYSLERLPRNITSWKEYYQVHDALERGKFLYKRTEMPLGSQDLYGNKQVSDAYSNKSNALEYEEYKERNKVYLCAWAVNSDQAYTVALCK